MQHEPPRAAHVTPLGPQFSHCSACSASTDAGAAGASSPPASEDFTNPPPSEGTHEPSDTSEEDTRHGGSSGRASPTHNEEDAISQYEWLVKQLANEPDPKPPLPSPSSSPDSQDADAGPTGPANQPPHPVLQSVATPVVSPPTRPLAVVAAAPQYLVPHMGPQQMLGQQLHQQHQLQQHQLLLHHQQQLHQHQQAQQVQQVHVQHQQVQHMQVQQQQQQAQLAAQQQQQLAAMQQQGQQQAQLAQQQPFQAPTQAALPGHGSPPSAGSPVNASVSPSNASNASSDSPPVVGTEFLSQMVEAHQRLISLIETRLLLPNDGQGVPLAQRQELLCQLQHCHRFVARDRNSEFSSWRSISSSSTPTTSGRQEPDAGPISGAPKDKDGGRPLDLDAGLLDRLLLLCRAKGGGHLISGDDWTALLREAAEGANEQLPQIRSSPPSLTTSTSSEPTASAPSWGSAARTCRTSASLGSSEASLLSEAPTAAAARPPASTPEQWPAVAKTGAPPPPPGVGHVLITTCSNHPVARAEGAACALELRAGELPASGVTLEHSPSTSTISHALAGKEAWLFCGHADAALEGSTSLAFARPKGGDGSGGAFASLEVVDAHAVVTAVAAHAPTLRLVLLNGCDSLRLGEALVAAGVGHAVCWEGRLDAEAALEFSVSFARALARGSTAEGAVHEAAAAVLGITERGLLDDGVTPCWVQKFELVPAAEGGADLVTGRLPSRGGRRGRLATGRPWLLRLPEASLVHGLPAPPPLGYVVRRQLEAALLAAVTEHGRSAFSRRGGAVRGAQTRAAQTVLVGGVGCGKTALAWWAATQVRVQALHPGGVVWISLAPTTAAATVVASVLSCLGEDGPAGEQEGGALGGGGVASDEELDEDTDDEAAAVLGAVMRSSPSLGAVAALRRRLAGRRVLLVLDGVTREAQLAGLEAATDASQTMLVTTRHAALARGRGSVEVGGMDLDESLALLGRALQPACADPTGALALQPETHVLISGVGGVPSLLHAAAAACCAAAAERAVPLHAGELGAALADAWHRAAPRELTMQRLRELGGPARRRVAQLALVMGDDGSLDVAALHGWWGAEEAASTLDELRSWGLLAEEGQPGQPGQPAPRAARLSAPLAAQVREGATPALLAEWGRQQRDAAPGRAAAPWRKPPCSPAGSPAGRDRVCMEGRRPAAAPSPCTRGCSALMRGANLFAAGFSSEESIETAFAVDQFSKAYSPFNAFCAVLLAATTMLGQGSPHLFYGTTAAALMIVLILVARVWLHRLPDQARALVLFGRGWASLVTCFGALVLLKMHLLGPGSPVSALALTGVATLWLLVPLYTRITAVQPAHRAIVSAVAALTFILTPSWSILEQPYEGQIICTALLVGELLGYTWEHATKNLVTSIPNPAYKPLPSHESAGLA